MTRATSLLVLSRGGHPGVDDALRRMTADGTLTRAWHETVDMGEARPNALGRFAQTVQDRCVDMVVLHHYHAPTLPDPRRFIETVQALPTRPVVAFTGGDPFYNGFFRPAHPDTFRWASSAADIVLNTSMGRAARTISQYGAKRVALLPNGACQVRFVPNPKPHRPQVAEFDVCFIGSNNRSRHPGRSYFWYGWQRERLVRSLSRRFGSRFAVFGYGWSGLPSAQGPAAFDEQLETCRRAKVVIGGVPYSPARYYTSNRPFIQISSGVPFVDIRVSGADRILRDGEHWHLVDSTDRVGDKVDELLSRSDSERQEMGHAAAAFVAACHTDEHRWRSLVETLSILRTALIENRPPPPPDLPFFLPEVDVDRERLLATLGW